ncbi:acetyl-CoA carboxylase biotin carboxyl carrier protein [Paenibacillus sp. YN15]|uniref:acetyl-CoA carboxylase biotin carboxyl carrier protein n=1 Tax=Paenibacillus sp. YN15 TaxID=1742774 RepID=UPI000DCE3466|nr:acetyl-CoA carboxylase biotin carboxyl carrier protein [Paenibacillus sp. YN15]RAV00974.1 acetyl-CoA carboxylase biotin carboxyl carrier protein [Paenibacillus sp. YN15]
MFKLSEIKELIRLVDQSNLQELEIQNEGYKLYLKKPGVTESLLVTHTPAYQAAPAPAAVSAEAVRSEPAQEKESQAKQEEEGQLHRIVSPMVGTYYYAPTPDAPPFVKAGDRVTEKTVVCIVEAMKLMNEIEAEVKGEIVQVLVENGQLVEYGQPLFLVRV